MRKEAAFGIAAIALIIGFGIGAFAGFDLSKRQVEATKLGRDLTGILTSATTLELTDHNAIQDIRQLHVTAIAAYTREAREKTLAFKRNPVKDARLIQGVARAEAWAKQHKVTSMAADLGGLREKLQSISQ